MDGITLTQKKFTTELLREARLDLSKTVVTHLPLNLKLQAMEGELFSDPSFNSCIKIYSIHSRPRDSFERSRKSKKQGTVSRSSSEAEYRSMSSAASEVTWLVRLLEELGVTHLKPVTLYCDNQSAIHIAKNPLTKEECNDAFNDMSTELYHLCVSLKSLAKENSRIKENNLFLSDRNAMLEDKREREREQEVIKAWKTSRDVSAQIAKVQGIESFCETAWDKNKKKLELIDGLSADMESTDDESYPLKEEKEHSLKVPQLKQADVSKSENLKKLNKKFGSTSKNFVKEEASTSKDVSKVNIGHMTLEQLKNRLKGVEDKKETKRKSNRNGKVGVNKHNNYTPDKYAPRKSCVHCSSVNHLSANCKSIKKTPMHVPSSMPNMSASPLHAMPVMSQQNPYAHFANMPYFNNPYLAAFSMPQMPYNMPMWNNMFAQSMSYQIPNVLNDSLTNPTPQPTTSKINVDSKLPKSKDAGGMKSRRKANKNGPKETWVPKST
ncbi:hypothetical protein AgCh_039850 [Apium graveolens]